MYNKLHKKMGLKSAKVVDLSFSRIKGRKVEFSEGVMYLDVLTLVENERLVTRRPKILVTKVFFKG